MIRPPHKLRAARPLALALAALATAAIAGCGGGEQTLPSPSLEQWQARVDGFCSDGIQETLALVPPKTTRQIPADAQARAEILDNVRDEAAPLPRPDGYDSQIEAWLAGVGSDIKLLNRIATAATSGGDYLTMLGDLDASTGDLATPLGLPDCQQLSVDIANTSG